MALDAPSTLGRTSSSSHQPPPPGPHVHTSVITKEVSNLLLPPTGQNSNNGNGGDRVRSGSARPKSASAAGRLTPRTASSGLSGMTATTTTTTTTNPNTSLAGMLEAQLLRGDYDHERLHLGTTNGAALLATSTSERTLGYNHTLIHTHNDTASPGYGATLPLQQQQLNASGSQACLACNRPLRDAGGRPPPRLSSMPWLLSSFEQEMALLSTQVPHAMHQHQCFVIIIIVVIILQYYDGLAHYPGTTTFSLINTEPNPFFCPRSPHFT